MIPAESITNHSIALYPVPFQLSYRREIGPGDIGESKALTSTVQSGPALIKLQKWSYDIYCL